jgi:hypothetical protein
LAVCSLVQAREPATGIIVIDIPAVLDCADAINDLPAVIKFKDTSAKRSRLQFGCASFSA